MSSDLDTLYTQWAIATDNLQPGVKRVFREVLSAVESGDMTTLVWGQDYGDGGACLVNSAGVMLQSHVGVKEGGGQGIPSQGFGELVSLFDKINRELKERGVNTDRHVSPLAADILLHHYAPDKPSLTAGETIKAINNALPQDIMYVEPSDEEIRESLLHAFSGEAPSDVVDTPFDDYSDYSDDYLAQDHE